MRSILLLLLLPLWASATACPKTLVCPREGARLEMITFANISRFNVDVLANVTVFNETEPGDTMLSSDAMALFDTNQADQTLEGPISIQEALALGCSLNMIFTSIREFATFDGARVLYNFANATGFAIAPSQFGRVKIGYGDKIVVNVVAELQAMIGTFTTFFSRAFASVSVDIAAFLHPVESYEVYEQTSRIVIPYGAHPSSARILDEESGSMLELNNTMDFANITEAKSQKFVFSRVPPGNYELAICFVAMTYAEAGANFTYVSFADAELLVRDIVIAVKTENPYRPC